MDPMDEGRVSGSILPLVVGPLLTAAGAFTHIGVIVKVPALADLPGLGLSIVLAGLGLTLWGFVRTFARRRTLVARVLGGVALALSVALASFFCAYVFVLSYGLPPATERALSIAQAPDFALADAEGRIVRSTDYRGRKLVLVFYRGYW